MLKNAYEYYQRFYHFWKWQQKKELNLNLVGSDVWPEDPFITIDILQRTLQGPDFNIPLKDLWENVDLSSCHMEYFHSFQWLKNLRQHGDSQGRLIGRDCITQWCERSKKLPQEAWNIDVLGRRLACWLKLYEFFAASAPEDFRKILHNSIFQQSRYLESCFIIEESPLKRLFSLKGLILSQLAIPEFEKKLRFSLQWLLNELKMQILEDGCHYSRNPNIQVTVLKDLLDIRSALKAHKNDTFLQSYIEKMVPVLRLLRHGDGGIAYFNQGYYCKPELIDRVLSYADTQGKPPLRTFVSGFERLQSEKTLLLANMGEEVILFKKDKEPSLANGPLYNFEMSIGKQRVITTLPKERFAPFPNEHLEQNSAVILEGLGRAHRHNPTERVEQEGNKLIAGKCFWNFQDCSYSHSRQLFIDPTGKDIRGQDTFQIYSHFKTFSSGQPFSILFHFHPTIQIQEMNIPYVVLLKIPTIGQWYFYLSQNLILEKKENNHYLEKMHKGSTIILKGMLSYPKGMKESITQTIKWAFKSE